MSRCVLVSPLVAVLLWCLLITPWADISIVAKFATLETTIRLDWGSCVVVLGRCVHDASCTRMVRPGGGGRGDSGEVSARWRASARWVGHDAMAKQGRERREHGGRERKQAWSAPIYRVKGGGEELGRGEDGDVAIKTPLMVLAITPAVTGLKEREVGEGERETIVHDVINCREEERLRGGPHVSERVRGGFRRGWAAW
jgi:hypothetical protein